MSAADRSPAQCPKSASPYNYCPLVFRHEDDMILSAISMLATDIKRLSHHNVHVSSDEAKAIDRASCIITAYMNGRVHEAIKQLTVTVGTKD